MLNERKLSKSELEAREKIIKDLKKNKSSLVKRYGKDAESVMYGRATNIVKNMKKSENKNKLKELVKKTLMQEQDIEVGADRYEEEQKLLKASALLNNFEDDLKTHDWSHMMSDDYFGRDKPGQQKSDELKKLGKELSDMGFEKEASILYNKYNPFKNISFEKFIAPPQPFIPGYKRKQMGLDEKSEFPDLTGDGKVTKADILKGRGVDIEEETRSVGPMIKSKEFKVGDKVKYKGMNHEITRIVDDRIYIKNLKYSGRPDTWVKDIDLKKSVKEDIDLGHEDNEPHMIKGELYQIGKYAMDLYAILEELEEKGGEYDFPAWWQSKITTAKNMMSSAKHYLDFELKEPAIDAAVDALTGEEPHMGEPEAPMMNEDEIGKDEILAGRLYKIKNHVQPAFYQKVRMMINNGDLEKAEEFISRMEPVSAKKDTEFAAMKNQLDSLTEKLIKKLKSK